MFHKLCRVPLGIFSILVDEINFTARQSMVRPTHPQYNIHYLGILHVQSSKIYTLEEKPCSY